MPADQPNPHLGIGIFWAVREAWSAETIIYNNCKGLSELVDSELILFNLVILFVHGCACFLGEVWAFGYAQPTKDVLVAGPAPST